MAGPRFQIAVFSPFLALNSRRGHACADLAATITTELRINRGALNGTSSGDFQSAARESPVGTRPLDERAALGRRPSADGCGRDRRKSRAIPGGASKPEALLR